jgi:large conductance mechanosensitive channel
MAMMEEFKKFAMKGNVVDLAVGVIIGGAFGDRRFAGAGRHHAADRQAVRRPRFRQLLLPLNGQAYGLPLAEAKRPAPCWPTVIS